jgi:hypothetical protein
VHTSLCDEKGPAKNREKDSIKIRKEKENLFTKKLPCFTS